MFQKHFPPKDTFFFFFLNCTLLQTTACNEVKHHRNNAGIQQKSCLSTSSNTNVLLVYKSNRIKEYILKSEVKIKWLKNLEEKKKKKSTMYIYLQVNRSNIIQVWLAIQGQAGATKVHIIQHCMTFSFVNPKWLLKRQNTFQEVVFKVSIKKCLPQWAGQFVPSQVLVFIKTSRAFWLKHSFTFFFFFLHDFKNYINDSNVIIVFAKRNPLNISFWGSVFPMLIPSLQLKEAHKAFSLEEGGRANETVDGCVVWHLHSVINRTDGLISKNTGKQDFSISWWSQQCVRSWRWQTEKVENKMSQHDFINLSVQLNFICSSLRFSSLHRNKYTGASLLGRPS